MIQVGVTYKIDHSRNGRFVGKVIEFSDTWVTVRITEGNALWYGGEDVTIRREFATFQELESK